MIPAQMQNMCMSLLEMHRAAQLLASKKTSAGVATGKGKGGVGEGTGGGGGRVVEAMTERCHNHLLACIEVMCRH